MKQRSFGTQGQLERRRLLAGASAEAELAVNTIAGLYKAA
jgi:hypothetical protein